MQEPPRLNLLNILQGNLKLAQKKTYLQRTIYFAKCTRDLSLGPQEGRVFNILLESNIRLINEEYTDDMITGFGLFYDGYFINAVEGTEESILRHLETLLETLDQKASNTPDVEKIKVLLTIHNMNARYFTTWNGRLATPPVLLDKIEPTMSTEVNTRHVKNMLMKLYKLFEFLKSKPPHLLKAAMDNISELCQPHLPEVMLLEFLLDSPALLDLREYVQCYETVPEFTLYDEVVWPVPSDFVPYHILSDDGGKKLMEIKEEKKVEKDAKEEDAKPEEAKPEEAKTEEAKTEEAKTEEAKPEKADDPKVGQAEDVKTEEATAAKSNQPGADAAQEGEEKAEVPESA